MFGALKTTAFRLAISATICTGAFVCSTVFYFAVYYFIMPVLIQEAPIHFSLQKFDSNDKTVAPGGIGFAPQPALFCHLPIESALTEFKRKVTQHLPSNDAGDKEAESLGDDVAAFSSHSGPYIYDKGSLR